MQSAVNFVARHTGACWLVTAICNDVTSAQEKQKDFNTPRTDTLGASKQTARQRGACVRSCTSYVPLSYLGYRLRNTCLFSLATARGLLRVLEPTCLVSN